MAGSRLHKFPLLTAADLEDTPSRRDGVTKKQEAKLWRRMGIAIYDTAKAMVPAMSSGTAAVAMTFVARFYSMKSILRNHPPLIAAAALALAGKVNDEPRRMDSLTVEVIKRWYGRDNVELQRAMAAPDYSASLSHRVQEAEEMLMYTLKFDFDVTPLISSAMRTYIRVPELAKIRFSAHFQQFLLFTGNDIMKRDAGIVLMFRPEEVALAICQLYFKIERQHGNSTAALEPPSDAATGAAWYVQYGLSEDRHRAISKRLQALYANVERQEEEDGTLATATVSMGGAAASSGDVGAQSGPAAASAGGDGKEGPSSGAAGARGGRRMVSIRQRTAAAKRARSALEGEESQKAKEQYFYKPEAEAAKAAAAAGPGGGSQVFSDSQGASGFPSSQQGYHGYAPNSQYSQLYEDLDAAPAGGYGGRHPAAPVPAPTPTPAPAAGDDDELEEGEIEEGEIV